MDMIQILLDAEPTGHDQANSRLLQLFDGLRRNMLALVASSELKNIDGIIVIKLQAKTNFYYYFIEGNPIDERRFMHLFYGRLEIEELAKQILKLR